MIHLCDHLFRSWGKAFPQIIIDCNRTAFSQQTPINIFALNPIHPDTLAIVEEIFTQITSIFPSRYMHIGGDEVELRCWNESQEVVCMNININKIFKVIL